MKTTLEQRTKNEELFKIIFMKCWENNEFKNNFIDHPVRVLEKENGKSLLLADNKNKVIVEDQTDPNIIYLNIPAKEELDFEMTEDELQMVSGGALCGGLCVGAVFVACVVIGWLATE